MQQTCLTVHQHLWAEQLQLRVRKVSAVPSAGMALAEIITRQFLRAFDFVIILVVITTIIPPEHFLCNVAATGLSLFAGEHAKEFAL